MNEIFLNVFFFAVTISYLWRKTPIIITEVKKSISMAKSALKIKEAMKPVAFVALTEEETIKVQREVRKLRREVDVLNSDLERSKSQAKQAFEAFKSIKELAEKSGVSHLLGL